MRRKKRAIIFGAGAAGVNAYHLLKNKYKILCFADNDIKKHGALLLGLSIISADDINKHFFDITFIASTYQHQILKQLVDRDIVPRDKIEIVSKDEILGKSGVYYFGFIVIFVMVLLLAIFSAFLLINWLK